MFDDIVTALILSILKNTPLGKNGEKERKTMILINKLTEGIQVNITFRLVDFISSIVLTDL